MLHPFRKYSSKIVIKDYNLTIHNNTTPVYIPQKEIFPFGIGVRNWRGPNNLTKKYEFSDCKISVSNLSKNEYIADHKNVSAILLNSYELLVGPVKYLNTMDSVPENKDYIFILNEEPTLEDKLDDIEGAIGCVLIENQTKEYIFENGDQYNFTIAKVNATIDTNFSSVLSEIINGSIYVVDNLQNNNTLVFSNYSNASCFPSDDFVYFVQLRDESDFDTVVFRSYLWGPIQTCRGVIISNYQNDSYLMSHTVRDWGWFNFWGLKNQLMYTNRFALPMFSINKTVGNNINNSRNNITVEGFIDQEYKQQTLFTPGIISNNVVGYRNISHSPDDAIVVLSNRIDGWWGQTPGDSGVGGAILLGIAKYFNDYNITPKYNLTFLFTTGEEYGLRGVKHYIDSHPNTGLWKYNFIHYIGFDQLGFNYTLSQDEKQTLTVKTDNEAMAYLINVIADQTNYEEQTNHSYNFITQPYHDFGAEDFFWKDNCDNTLLLEKNSAWDGHHQTGENYTKGDSLNYIDRNDVDVTFELAWNITKYFTVNPDCHFHSITYEAINISDGTAPDTLKATFTVKSILPNDLIMVNASFYNATTEYLITSTIMNYTINRTGVERNITFSLPSNNKEGDYYIKLDVYNSTARINRTLGFFNYSNDTKTSPTFHLNRYHTIGDIRIGSTSTTCHNYIRGSKYTLTEDALVHNITAYVYGTTTGDIPVYQCMIYRWNDGHLIGSTDQIQKDSTGWLTFSFNPRPILRNNTQYVLSIWGDNNAYVYSTYSYPVGNGYTNDTLTFGTPPEDITWSGGLMLYQHSLFCQYGLDLYPPKITNISATPDVVGFGFNITLSANVSDNGSGLQDVKIRISEPGGRQGNYSMMYISEDHYQYVYSGTWRVGQYNYSIWAQDNETNSATSATYHFNVSVEATISIATLSDSYSGTQYINITDPPNPPENYTIVGRGLTWDKYYNAVTGQNILETFTGPVNYQDENGTWTPINTTISPLPSNYPAYAYGYRTGNDHGLYGVYFKSNIQNDWPVAFTYNRSEDPTIHAIRTKLVGVGYVDPQSNWTYQYLQNVQSSQGQTNDYSITYPGVFTGADVTWSYGNTGLKEEIILSNTTKTMLQNHPPSQYGLNDASSYLVFITKLDYQNLNLYNGSGVLDGNVTISDIGVEFRDALGQFKCALPLGEIYELNNESMRQKLTYRIIHINGNTYLLSGLKATDLNTMMFPVVIDPTLTVYASFSDAYIEQSSTSYNTAWTASTGAVYDTADFINIGQYKFKTTYYIYRGFVHFNTSSLPSNAYLDNATLSLYKRTDYSTTDFDITIQNGQPTYPHDPVQPGDYDKTCYLGNGGSLNTADLISGYNAISLTNLTWINTTGLTKLCLRSSREISGTAPTGNEFVSVYSKDFIFSYPPKLVIYYRNQSKIKNTGFTEIQGYLLIQVQFWDTRTDSWVLESDTVNETTPRIIYSNNQLALDLIFNGQVRASDLTHGSGTYRVYAAFRDPEGSILKTNDETELVAWWEFTKT